MLPYYVFLNLGDIEMIAGDMGDEVKVLIDIIRDELTCTDILNERW
jgi:hypothetical protein